VDFSKNRNSSVNTEIEDGPSEIRRLRLLGQLDLRFTDLTAEQSAAVDALCNLLPLIDEPMILDRVVPSVRPQVCELLRRLPVTHEITRYLADWTMDYPQYEVPRRLRQIRPGRCLDHVDGLARLADAAEPAATSYVLAGGTAGGVQHAWLESATVVCDLTTRRRYWSKPEYYEHFRPTGLRFATAADLKQAIREHGRRLGWGDLFGG
jgi:hypothetical protein